MSGSRSMQGKHSWLHFVNYLIYTSIQRTIISHSGGHWGQFRNSNQGRGATPTRSHTHQPPHHSHPSTSKLPEKYINIIPPSSPRLPLAPVWRSGAALDGRHGEASHHGTPVRKCWVTFGRGSSVPGTPER